MDPRKHTRLAVAAERSDIGGGPGAPFAKVAYLQKSLFSGAARP